MNIDLVKELQAKVNAFKKEIKEEFGVDLSCGTYNYSDIECSVKLTFKKAQNGVNLEESTFVEFEKKYGTSGMTLNKEYTINRKPYVFVGMTKTSNTYNGYRPTFKDENGKIAIFRISVLETLAELPTLTETFCCKYCGRPSGSTNKDELCSECKETFGHSLYSEL